MPRPYLKVYSFNNFNFLKVYLIVQIILEWAGWITNFNASFFSTDAAIVNIFERHQRRRLESGQQRKEGTSVYQSSRAEIIFRVVFPWPFFIRDAPFSSYRIEIILLMSFYLYGKK
jgi:hypothetical protein